MNGDGARFLVLRCGNVAAILELDENLNKNFKVGCGFTLFSRSTR